MYCSVFLTGKFVYLCNRMDSGMITRKHVTKSKLHVAGFVFTSKENNLPFDVPDSRLVACTCTNV